ncbi:hypothetical protein KC331_g3893 [Hortaea werneckii]|uniref:ATPase synthesis protein 25 n=1 Tax=Hortaea werneckii TaxID=91943 RepID=A0A3M7BUJ3_HORWE|nr:hypothetical protein KC331_g3893 [Hortaea werneckii]KAI7715848.1 hypothetical protein KC353_g5778 [Hortaea werneckii]RMY43399.1 hypothetical protein D0865_11275 [Hortaea werneckii]
MALQTAALRSLACHSCRQWALRSFIASIGGPSIVQAPPPVQQRRPFSHHVARRNEARERAQQQEDHVLNEIKDIGKTAPPQEEHPETQSEAEESLETSEVPWYLQPEHQLPTREAESPMAARQRIPDLPEHSPQLLQPLLEHVSVELGMDDLSLLDLRQLDPPAALGANLFMIVGTARSEKHLHVSADRLCRWLRSEPHFLTPFADGLLGRNELKLKMRRRAKRSRLMAGVGAKSTADSELEEGIRTGWVCVNVGRVEGGELLEQKAERNKQMEGFVGFGSPSGGSRIVVQIMTEEKRGEIDLEKLWTGILSRSLKEKEEASGREKDEEVEQAASARKLLDPVPAEADRKGEPHIDRMPA